MKLKCALLFFALFLSSCSSLKKSIQPPKINLEDVRVAGMSFLNMDLEVVLGVENPNNIDFDVKNLKYSLDVNSKTVTTGTMKDKVLVKSKTKTVVSLPIKLQYKDILSSAVMLLEKDGMPYKVQGSADIGPFTIPFSDNGILKSTDL